MFCHSVNSSWKQTWLSALTKYRFVQYICKDQRKIVTISSLLRKVPHCNINKSLKTFKGGIFWIFSVLFFNTSSSADPQIPLCRRMLGLSPGQLGLNLQDSWIEQAYRTAHYTVHTRSDGKGCQSKRIWVTYFCKKLLCFLCILFILWIMDGVAPGSK